MEFGHYLPLVLLHVCSLLSLVAAQCGQTSFTNEDGRIQSPSYPSRYASYAQTCTYDIRTYPDKRVTLSWVDFNVGGKMPDCTSSTDDSVAIYIGCSRKFLTRFCSLNAATPHTIYSPDNCMRIVFKSSSSSKGGSFWASYSSSYRGDPISSSTYCKDGTKYSKTGVIYSPRWPTQYPYLSSECEWKLKTDSSYVYKLNFMAFDVYKGSYCSSSFSDKVIVKGKKSQFTSSENKNYYCGFMSPFSLRTRYYELEIDFEQWRRTSKSATGFMIGYVAYKPDDLPSTSAGVGSIIGGIIAIIIVGICVFLAVRIYRGRCSNRGQRTTVRSVPANQQPIVTSATTYSSVPPQVPGYPAGAAPYPQAQYPAPGQGPYAPPQGQYPAQMPYQGSTPYPQPQGYPPQNAAPPPYQDAAAMPSAGPMNQNAPYPPSSGAPYPPSSGAPQTWDNSNQQASAPPPPY